MRKLDDAQTRLQAIDPTQSIIVQAPAGSGKTELLMQRILRLLTTVKEPEHIVALTFTKKAAHEMRHRVIQALLDAQLQTPVLTDHAKHTRTLAEAALNHANEQQWHLIESPYRLRIQTIDALCLRLCQSAPSLTLLPLDCQPSELPHTLYEKAIEQCLKTQANSMLRAHVKRLLLHLDNSYTTFERLLKQLLAKRDQWLPLLMPYHQTPKTLRAHCEDILKNIVNEAAESLVLLWDEDILNHFWQAFVFSQQQLNPDYLLDPLNNGFLDPEYAVAYWQQACRLLLTDKDQWRKPKGVTKRLGFNTEHKEEKKHFQDLLLNLSESEQAEAICEQLAMMRRLPDTHYSDERWAVLESCLLCLPEIVAQLHLVFQHEGSCDFIEMNLAALRVLGMDDISETALAMDRRIYHLLVDECQDTSITQAHLLQTLMQGWEPDDGRTLFMVGDPMQSIYRFREAEVTLFHLWQTQGFGHINLIPLHLTANFRSQEKLIDWFNACFQEVFPNQVCTQSGGVPYSPAQAILKAQDKFAMQAHIEVDGDSETEASRIIQSIKTLQQDCNNPSIAILVQSRMQCQPIIKALHQEAIAFCATDIEPLFHHPAAQDWLVCLRALCHCGDRVAWCALLRSPIVGLTLTQLHNITERTESITIWQFLENLSDDDSLLQSSPALAQCRHSLSQLFKTQSQLLLWQWIDRAWRALGFDLVYNTEQAQAIIQQCIALLQSQPWHRAQFDLNHFLDLADGVYCKSDSTANITLMTIHKSKGLEFDHVLIPGIQRRPVNDASSLIAWQTIPSEHHLPQLCIAPIAAPEDDHNRIYDYCRLIEKQKLEQERRRLLYVAATRAKTSLTFFASMPSVVDRKTGECCNPKAPSGSFAALIWPWIESQGTMHRDTIGHTDDAVAAHPELLTPNNTFITTLNDHSRQEAKIMPTNNPPATYDFIQQYQRHLDGLMGECLHDLCELLATKLLLTQASDQINFAKLIAPYRFTEQQEKHVLQSLTSCLQGMMNDPIAQWIFDHNHQDAHSEWCLLEKSSKGPATHILDRTFIDSDKRWIIDYKSAKPHAEQSIEDFLEQQKAFHSEQLSRYAQCLTTMGESLPIHCGLYFPFAQLWVSWCAVEASGCMVL